MALPAPTDTTTAIVTGASSGIGEQFAKQLAARGHHVTLTARSTDNLGALAAELGGEARVAVVTADLADPDQRDALTAAVGASGREVSILVNNAGFGVYEPFRRSDRGRELEQVRLLVEAPLDLTHRYWGAMCAAGRGAVVFLSSTSAFQPLPYNAAYAAAKSYVLFLSEALHAEGADDGVTVTAVCPGPVPTGFQAASDASITDKLPKQVWVSAEVVAEQSLAGVEAGKRVVVPGNAAVRALFTGNRYTPPAVTNPGSKWLMRK